MSRGKVSAATKKNWKRMGISGEGRLRRGANKKSSERRFLPMEYVSNPENISIFLEWTGELSRRTEPVEDILYSIGRIVWKQRGVGRYNPFPEQAIRRYARKCLDISVPKWHGEEDFLGILYQSLRQEGERNFFGAYYTPREIVQEMTRDLDFSSGQRMLDPCLGSGSFLLESGAPPDSIIGLDIDPVAVMISLFNFYLHFPNYEGVPSFFSSDFLTTEREDAFDYVVTNPPWGSCASTEESEDTFVRFFRRAAVLVKSGGEIRFLVPESVLNVRMHERFRKDLLGELNLTELRFHRQSFDGVMSGAVELRAKKEEKCSHLRMISSGKELFLKKKEILLLPRANFSWLESEDFSILHKVKRRGRWDLSSGKFALGIVTGDNARHLLRVSEEGAEPIVVGKDIFPFELKESTYFIRYDRTEFQQVASDEMYRTVPKLVYRFISQRPVVAPDYEGRLCLNSANILIPNIPGMSMETVAAFLNSDLYAYLYMVLFGERKILKGNLMQLSFPEISAAKERRIRAAVQEFGAAGFEIWNTMISDEFELNEEERMRIQERLSFDKKKCLMKCFQDI